MDSYTDALGYTVSFSVPNGVTAPAPMNSQAGGSVTLPTADAPAGYTFVGWVTADVNNSAAMPSGILTSSYTPTADIALKALYSHTDTVSGGFALVTAAPDAWEGSYVITRGNTDALVALKGIAGTKKYESATAGGADAFAATGMTLENGVLGNVSDAYIFTVTANGDKFTVQNAATGTYLASRGGYLYSYKTDTASYCRWSFAAAEGTVDATNLASRACCHLSFSAKNYFTINRAANPEIFFWKQLGATVTTVYTTVID